MITSKEHFWRSDFIHCAISTLTVVVPCLTKSNFSTTALDMSTIRFREVGPQRSAPKLECTAAITWFVDTLVSWPKRGSPASKYQASPLECGGRGGIRTPGLLIANDGENKLRCGVSITYLFRHTPQIATLATFRLEPQSAFNWQTTQPMHRL